MVCDWLPGLWWAVEAVESLPAQLCPSVWPQLHCQPYIPDTEPARQDRSCLLPRHYLVFFSWFPGEAFRKSILLEDAARASPARPRPTSAGCAVVLSVHGVCCGAQWPSGHTTLRGFYLRACPKPITTPGRAAAETQEAIQGQKSRASCVGL